MTANGDRSRLPKVSFFSLLLLCFFLSFFFFSSDLIFSSSFVYPFRFRSSFFYHLAVVIVAVVEFETLRLRHLPIPLHCIVQ